MGEWVLVAYDADCFPGEITDNISNSETDIEVNVMHHCGSGWKWPKNLDKIYYDRKDIIRTDNSSKVAGNRGQFTFDTIF